MFVSTDDDVGGDGGVRIGWEDHAVNFLFPFLLFLFTTAFRSWCIKGQTNRRPQPFHFGPTSTCRRFVFFCLVLVTLVFFIQSPFRFFVFLLFLASGPLDSLLLLFCCPSFGTFFQTSASDSSHLLLRVHFDNVLQLVNPVLDDHRLSVPLNLTTVNLVPSSPVHLEAVRQFFEFEFSSITLAFVATLFV